MILPLTVVGRPCTMNGDVTASSSTGGLSSRCTGLVYVYVCS